MAHKQIVHICGILFFTLSFFVFFVCIHERKHAGVESLGIVFIHRFKQGSFMTVNIFFLCLFLVAVHNRVSRIPFVLCSLNPCGHFGIWEQIFCGNRIGICPRFAYYVDLCVAVQECPFRPIDQFFQQIFGCCASNLCILIVLFSVQLDLLAVNVWYLSTLGGKVTKM